ncbi:Disease resistance-like protein DSC1 [Vitis vinifera]|uniref:Disease resistance-like protein DSC1 n=1 Tax=Vitis vinifera TaxID=29760 RepID=A0A438HQ05_VITVI|nr:Disease resistance-like protein DSC1 [Vitis vinifera]
MKKLRLLKVYYSLGDKHKMSLPKDFEFPPNLNYLHWEGLVSLPSNFHGEKLVAINLKSSNIKELLKGEKRLWLSDSGIKELPTSIECLEALEDLLLNNCSNFEKFPEIQKNMENLWNLDLSDSGIKELSCLIEIFPEIMEDMEHSKGLSLRESAITELPSSMCLYLSNCENLETLPNSIGMTCVNRLVEQSPMIYVLVLIGRVKCEWNNIDCIPGGIIRLSRLRTLTMNNCLMLKEIPELPSSLRRIEADGCPLLETLSSDAKHPLWSSLHNCLKSQIQDCIGCPIYLLILVLKYDCVRVVIPGSRGIPEWISHKSMGDEITIDLPKNWYEDNNFLGFALFWHHVPFDDDDDDDYVNQLYVRQSWTWQL